MMTTIPPVTPAMRGALGFLFISPTEQAASDSLEILILHIEAVDSIPEGGSIRDINRATQGSSLQSKRPKLDG
jgi:hypothetical protein